MVVDLKELQIQVLSAISQILGQALNLDQALESIIGVLSRSLSLKYACVTLQDPETGQVRCRASRDLTAAGQSRAGCRPGESPPLSASPLFCKALPWGS
jgi:Nif-specific regulatory protein